MPSNSIWVLQVSSTATKRSFIGQAFPVPPITNNVAYLKDSIKAKMPNALKDVDAHALTIYAPSDEAHGDVKVLLPGGVEKMYKKVTDPKESLVCNDGKDDPPYLFETPDVFRGLSCMWPFSRGVFGLAGCDARNPLGLSIASAAPRCGASVSDRGTTTSCGIPSESSRPSQLNVPPHADLLLGSSSSISSLSEAGLCTSCISHQGGATGGLRHRRRSER
jgi:hypothetical protein